MLSPSEVGALQLEGWVQQLHKASHVGPKLVAGLAEAGFSGMVAQAGSSP